MISGNQFWELLNLSENNPEYELYKSLVEEFTDISGFPIEYFVKLESESIDDIYGEDPNAKYTDGYRTKLVYEPTEEENILDSFGITSDELISYMQIPKSIFTRDIEEEYNSDYSKNTELKPKPGDCIRTLWNNKLYELVETGSEQKIFQARKMIWEMVARPYRHSEESDSANEMLDDIPDELDFPDENTTTETTELSSHGDNKTIEDDSDFDNDADTGVYGF